MKAKRSRRAVAAGPGVYRFADSLPLKILIVLIFFTIAMSFYVSVVVQSMDTPSQTLSGPISSTDRTTTTIRRENDGSTASHPVLSDPERQPILKILQSAGYDLNDNKTFTPDVLEKLPKWSEIIDLYGEKPTILGLETCPKYRKLVPEQNRREGGVAGLFNSGTNVLHSGKFTAPLQLEQSCWLNQN